MAAVSFHFHGYQPGDLVRWIEPDPMKPPRFEERVSPVALTIGDERVRGRNWTDAVLRTYGSLERVLEGCSGSASIDIEPQTLAWLLKKDEPSYRRVVAAYERGVAGLALTPPFHPILPHHHRLERENLFEMMLDFYAPILRRVHEGPVGLWLPETAYSGETIDSYLLAARRTSVELRGLPDMTRAVHLLLDARQLPGEAIRSAWHRTGALSAMARDHGLSNDFAFGVSPANAFADSVGSDGRDVVLVAADLESLLANPTQARRFEDIVRFLRERTHQVAWPTPQPKANPVEAIEFSSWSDYDEHLPRGQTSDTRWTGIRRADGFVVGRMHRGRRLSQLWKHAFTVATEQVETAIRRTARDLLPGRDIDWKREALRRLAVAYGRLLWRDHYRALGYSLGDTDFAQAASAIAGELDAEAAAHLARAYVTMLMGLRSDSRFWDNPDTRVTFQTVVCLTQSLIDMGNACAQAKKRDLRERLVGVLRATLLEFSDAYARNAFSELQGADGWETTEAAWYESLASEVPHRSSQDIVRRATISSLAGSDVEGLVQLAGGEFVQADTGHISGEAHGEWECPEWCESRTG